MNKPVMSFFAGSEDLDRLVLRPLSHINLSWELSWDAERGRFEDEPDTLAPILNALLDELDNADPPNKYHDNEDRLAEHVRDKLAWPIKKVGSRWVRTDGRQMDYVHVLELGGWADIDQKELTMAAAGRVRAARNHGQMHFDEMEEGHQAMLAAVMMVIVYHRSS